MWGLSYGVTPLFSGSEMPLLGLDSIDRRMLEFGWHLLIPDHHDQGLVGNARFLQDVQ